MSQVSPGVVLNEFDFSDYAERISTAICAMAGWANKGPVNTLTLVTNQRQLIDTFGFPPAPVTDGNLPVDEFGNTALRTEGVVLPAIHYLREGNQLFIVRVTNSAHASAVTVLQNGSAQDALELTALTPGTWPNPSTSSNPGRDVQFKIEAGTKGGTYFKLIIRENGVDREVFDNVTNDRTGTPDTDNLPENRITGVSKYVTAVGDANNGSPIPTTAYVNSGTGGGAAQEGDDGNSALDAADFYDETNEDKGLLIFKDPDTVDINLLAAPGVNAEISDPGLAVVQGMISIAEFRGDTLVLIDPPTSTSTVATARDFINGTGAFPHTAINSSYAAFYWPWIQVFDGNSGQQVWVPPSGIVAGIMSRTDRVSETWFAPAGFNRGLVTNSVRVQKNATLGEREQLYAAGEVVNPIVNFPGIGITVWGQKTTQRRATALNRVNVRRMLNFAKKVIATSVKFLVFEPNDQRTWRRFIHLVSPTLESIKTRRGLFDFKVICDETTNPPDQIDQNVMRGIILMKPTKTAEIITIDFTLLSTGASFNEFLNG